MPQKLFNEVRNEQIAAKKASRPAVLGPDEERGKEVGRPIRDYEAARARDRATKRKRK